MIHLRLLGPPAIEQDGQPLPSFKSRKVLALLAHLALSPGAHSRSELAGLLWSDCSEKQALDNLRYSLWNLNRVLRGPVLQADRLSVSFERHPGVQVDTDVFLQTVKTVERHDGPTPEDVARWQNAVDLYRGDLLAGLDLPGDLLMTEWLERQRALFREKAVNVLYLLAKYYTARLDLPEAIAATRRLLALDPWRDEAHRQLMLLFARSGQRSAALAQYETCRRVLASELGVEPSLRTRAWYTRIRESDSRRFHNLPVPATPFVGRTEELAQIAAHLQEPACRLLTLVGPGGIGKTRLALQTAAHHVDDFLHGVYLVPLAAVKSPDLLVPTIATHLAFAFSSSGDSKTQLLNYLAGKEMLLVLDNFEQLGAGGVPLLLEILQRAPQVKILITSRERLNIQSEWLYDVLGMSVTESGDGVQLFVASAKRIGAQLAPAEYHGITRICQLVGGLPLGIELAAAEVRQFSCQAIAGQIEQNLDCLATTMQDMPEKHRSLRAAFESSWNLLSKPEQGVLARLAVFRDGWPGDAAECVARASRMTLNALAEKSLVRRTPSGRYDMLQVVHQYAEEKLKEIPSEQILAQDLHCEWYAEFLSARDAPLKGGKQKQALDEIGGEIENVRASWRWAVTHGKTTALARMFDPLYLFFETMSWFQEGAQSLGMVAETLHGKDEILRAQVLARQGWMCQHLGMADQAKELYETSLAILRDAGARREMAVPLGNLGYAAWRQGNYATAKQMLSESLDIYQENGDRQGMARALSNLGIVASLTGDYVQARELYRQAVELFRQAGDRRGLAGSLNNLGIDARKQRDYAAAQSYLEESLAIREELGHRWGMAVVLNNLGNVIAARGDYRAAEKLYQQSLAISQDIGDRRNQVGAWINLGNAARVLGDRRAAQRHYQSAIKIGTEDRAIPQVVEAVLGLADIVAAEGDKVRAVEWYAFGLNHAACPADTRTEHAPRLRRIEAELDTSVYAAALERGKSAKLEEVAQQALTET